VKIQTPSAPASLNGKILPATRAGIVIADKAYDIKELVIAPLEQAGKRAAIPSKSNAKIPRVFGGRVKICTVPASG
jgi:hypothetical protein